MSRAGQNGPFLKYHEWVILTYSFQFAFPGQFNILDQNDSEGYNLAYKGHFDAHMPKWVSRITKSLDFLSFTSK